jgi:predicted DNA-binding protein (MmcQ/YjbR family)
MSKEAINGICGGFPGAERSEPFGPGIDVWKVGGKIFACIGGATPGAAVKTDSVETAEMLISAGVGTKAPYFHRSWVLLPYDADADELRHRITASYSLIRGSLTKAAQATLPAYDG